MSTMVELDLLPDLIRLFLRFLGHVIQEVFSALLELSLIRKKWKDKSVFAKLWFLFCMAVFACMIFAFAYVIYGLFQTDR